MHNAKKPIVTATNIESIMQVSRGDDAAAWLRGVFRKPSYRPIKKS